MQRSVVVIWSLLRDGGGIEHDREVAQQKLKAISECFLYVKYVTLIVEPLANVQKSGYVPEVVGNMSKK